jgi:hypothetical protein
MKAAVFAVLLGALVLCNTACEQLPPDEDAVSILEPPAEPPKDAIKIGSEADLKKIGTTDYPLSGNYALTADLTLSEWTPICPVKNPFTGAFYGQNHTITITSGFGGVFARMGDPNAARRAAVYNLTVDVTAIKSDGGNIGGIAGSAERSLIESCTVKANLTLNGTGHNASAGGVVGNMQNNTIIRKCTASGTVTLISGADAGLMVYAGGVAGYSGTGTAGSGASNCLITESRWTGASSTVSASGGYPYSGGIAGYNYTGAKITQCFSEGAVTATGSNLPYAGGIAGYNSGYAATGAKTLSLIENCYSTATVTAASSSKAALAGGIAGANAKQALISKCYARGAVTAKVTGSGGTNTGGSIGVKIAASAGGIAGAQYVENHPIIQYCAALNQSVGGEDFSSGAVWNVYRIAGEGSPAVQDTGRFVNNIAYSLMTVTNHADTWYKTDSGKDGADSAEKPAQSVFAGTGMDWDFNKVWTMGSGGYPVLQLTIEN